MSEIRNLWSLRLLALALAILAWFFFAVQQRERLSEKVVEAGVRYDNFPGLVILERVESVRVGLRGSEGKMRSLNPFLVEVFIELDEPAKGTFEVPLSADNVILPEDFEVISLQPNVIRLQLDDEIDHLLGVEAKLEGEPAAGAIVQRTEVRPSMVLVRGPRSLIDEISLLSTTPIDLTGHAITFEEQAAVLSPDSLVNIVQPAVVTVRINLQIPGTGNGEPEQPGQAPAASPGRG